MSDFRVLASATARIDDIYDYTADRWSDAQARAYVTGLFAHFQAIADRTVAWRTIPAHFGVEGHYTRYEQHLIFFKTLSSGDIGIAAILHDRMDIVARLSREFGASDA